MASDRCDAESSSSSSSSSLSSSAAAVVDRVGFEEGLDDNKVSTVNVDMASGSASVHKSRPALVPTIYLEHRDGLLREDGGQPKDSIASLDLRHLRMMRRASQPARSMQQHIDTSDTDESQEDLFAKSAASSTPSSPELKDVEDKRRRRSATDSIPSIAALTSDSSGPIHTQRDHAKTQMLLSRALTSEDKFKAQTRGDIMVREPRASQIYHTIQHMSLGSVRNEMWQGWRKASDFSTTTISGMKPQLLSEHVLVNMTTARQEILRIRQEVDGLWATTVKAMEKKLLEARSDLSERFQDARAQAAQAGNDALFRFQNVSKDLHGRIERFRAVIASSSPIPIAGLDISKLPELRASLADGMPAFPSLSHLSTEAIEALIRQEHSIQQSCEKFVEAFHIGRSRLLNFSELPKEWQDNPYVQHGYRFYGSHWGCVHSIWSWHNESCNIWTHLVGSLFVLLVAFWIYPHTEVFRSSTMGDHIVMGVFFAAALKCLVCSTIWHTFAGSAELRVFRAVACVDYIGISVLIAASVVTMEWYGFYTAWHLRALYITCTSVMGISGTIVPWMAWFDKPENRPLKIAFFLLLAMSALLPLAHLSLRHSLSETVSFFRPIIPSIALYVIGLSFYAGRFPERWYPGRIFDWVGGSHMIWHLLIVAAIYAHFAAVRSFHSQRYLFDPQSQHANKTFTRLLVPAVQTYVGESAATHLAALFKEL